MIPSEKAELETEITAASTEIEQEVMSLFGLNVEEVAQIEAALQQ